MNPEIRKLARRILDPSCELDPDDGTELAELVLDFEPDACEREHVTSYHSIRTYYEGLRSTRK